ncbi:MAG: 4a-hydroxytetrahydrobiopterin dehydratase [Acidimicrobiales bacterium]
MELLDEGALASALEGLDWELEDGQLVKAVRRSGFSGALAYVGEVAVLAERAGHHPDIEIHWDTVTLRLSTHSVGGITCADIALAAAIDGLL